MFRTSLSCSSLLLVAPITLFACGAAREETSADSLSDSVAEQTLSAKSLPTLPSETLAVPKGNTLAFYFDAVGVQIYACQAAASDYAWTFQAPEATLYDHRGRTVGKHYAGPTWEYLDGSKVVGTKVASFTADPTAVPELLLQGSSHEGNGPMSQVTYIQRLDTKGGIAPTGGCDAAHEGTTARVDYTATYYFYRAGNDNCKR